MSDLARETVAAANALAEASMAVSRQLEVIHAVLTADDTPAAQDTDRISDLEQKVAKLTSERDKANTSASSRTSRAIALREERDEARIEVVRITREASHQRARADAYRAMLEWLRWSGLLAHANRIGLAECSGKQAGYSFYATLSEAAGVTLPADEPADAQQAEQAPAEDPAPDPNATWTWLQG